MKDYVDQLTLKDFIKLDINDTQKYVHEVLYTVGKQNSIKMILVIDDVKYPVILSARPLITNILELSAIILTFNRHFNKIKTLLSFV